MSEFVSATFRELEAANAAVDRLVANGYRLQDVTVVMTPRWRETYFAAERAAGSSASGTTLRTLVGTAARTGSGRADKRADTGEMFVAGPLAAALGGANADASTKAVLNAVFGGITESEYAEFVGDLERGSIIIAVDARHGDLDETRRLLHTDVRSRREAASVK